MEYRRYRVTLARIDAAGVRHTYSSMQRAASWGQAAAAGLNSAKREQRCTGRKRWSLVGIHVDCRDD